MVHRWRDTLREEILKGGIRPDEGGLLVFSLAGVAAEETGSVPGDIRVGRHCLCVWLCVCVRVML